MEGERVACVSWKICGTTANTNLQLASQNLRDQASRLEKTLGNVSKLIVNNLGAGNIEGRQQEKRMESENSDLAVRLRSAKSHQRQWKICIWSVQD